MKRRVAAFSIAPFARAWLKSVARGRLMHVFEHACNIVASDGRMISLVSPEIGNGPFGLVVGVRSFSNGVECDTPVLVGEGLLRLGNLEVDTREAETWNPRPSWRALRDLAGWRMSHAEVLRQALLASAPAGSLAGLVVPLPGKSSFLQAGILREARPAAQMVAEGMRAGDAALCRGGATRLAGLGPGLTPDGDDVLLGCILAGWAGYGNGEASEMASVMAEEANRRTTIVSRSWLSAAARGECAEVWHALFEAMLANDVTAIRRAAEALIGVGHSSGASALAGFLLPLSSEGGWL